MNFFGQQRRKLLKFSLIGGLGVFVSNHWLSTPARAASLARAARSGLLPPDINGIRLPKGFSSRVIARSGQTTFGYAWHAAPDGGATFATQDKGWIYVSNSELDHQRGGVGAIRFSRQGEMTDAYSILQHTTRNCAGGHTPWQTWLSCEEYDQGQVWECDPFGVQTARLRPALGTFSHEAVAVDVHHKQLYLTEDKPDGCLYRYTGNTHDAAGWPGLDDGFLEVAEVIGGPVGKVRWHPLPDPLAIHAPTRYQIKQRTAFDGGEGIWYHAGIVYFTTKGDDRIWAYNTLNKRLSIVYNAAFYPNPVLTGVDNITANTTGELLVAEDGGDMQIVVVAPDTVMPLLQIVDHDRSEITGPSFNPDGTRLYFSSQRGASGKSQDGVTFEITGPF
ncbi:WD40-like Beta Propeller Repeat [Nitrosomonas sp. Nm51]|uniref:alkaline phosphatase PhoX n=1 Tax=Nitrosomonas sp. Nm51 TaxID=133720 RepID=UPI0008BC9DB7|nr:alkaline phosphatase PhoX [Nitrosomonas sp. Nm51]SER33077.1 WD40-like Beta Propeller Repeat [Nitrosomonas sp. Nm51]